MIDVIPSTEWVPLRQHAYILPTLRAERFRRSVRIIRVGIARSTSRDTAVLAPIPGHNDDRAPVHRLHAVGRRAVRLLEQLQAETEAFHADADGDALELLGPVGVADYWRFLVRTHGFVTPVERAIVQVVGIGGVVDVRRFHKHNLLRQDLLAFGMQPHEVDHLPQCPVPQLGSVEEALGWGYVVERSTLGHNNLFRHLGMVMPGDVAFTSAYLKCYFGAIGEMWRSFGNALDRYADPPHSKRVIDAARSAFRVQRTWRHNHDFEHEPPSDSGVQRSA